MGGHGWVIQVLILLVQISHSIVSMYGLSHLSMMLEAITGNNNNKWITSSKYYLNIAHQGLCMCVSLIVMFCSVVKMASPHVTAGALSDAPRSICSCEVISKYFLTILFYF